MAAEDILARFLQQQQRVGPEIPVRVLPGGQVPSPTERVVPQQPDSIPLDLPQPILEIPLGTGAVIEEPSSAENTLQKFLQQQTGAQQIVEQPSEDRGFFEGLRDLFTGETRRTPETEAAPELIRARGIPVSLEELTFFGKMLLTATDEEKENLVRTTLPDAKIRKDNKGNTFVTLPDGTETVLNKPGFSLQDAVDFASQTAIFTLAARFGGRFKGVPQKILAGGGAAAGTETARQAAVQQIGGREGISPLDIGLAGITGGIAEGVVPAARKIIGGIRRTAGVTPGVRDIPGVIPQEDVLLGIPKADLPAAEVAVREAREISKRTGFTIAPAQQLEDPQALRTMRLLAELSPSSRKAAEFIRTSNKEVFDEVERVLNIIAPEEGVETAAGRIRTAAEAAIKAKEVIRKEFADPIYDEAKKDLSRIALPKTRTLINTIKGELPPKEQTLITRVEDLLFPPGAVGKKFDPLIAPGRAIAKGFPTTKLHRAKVVIDDMISKRGEGSLGRTEKRELIEIQKEFLDELDIANPAYKRARKIFSDNSPAVKELKDSIIGKIVKLDNIQIEKIGETLFRPGNTVGTIKRAKKIIEEQDPQAWRDITRSVFENRLGNLKLTVEDITTQNIPAQVLQKLFGNLKQQKILFAGLDTESAKNLRWLQRGLLRVSKGRPGGSETAGRLERIKELTRIGAPKRTVLRAISERPVKSAGSVFADVFSGFQTQAGTEEDAIRLAGELYFNPKWQPSLSKIRKFNPDSPAGGKAFLKLLEDVSKPALQAARPQIGTVQPIRPERK